MGVALMTSLALLQAGTGISKIIEGETAKVRAETQGEILAKEKAVEARELLGKQTMQFLKSGVGLGGTPETIFDETVDFARQDINSIRNYYKDIGETSKRTATFEGLSNIIEAGVIGVSAFKQSLSPPLEDMGTNFTNLLQKRSKGGFSPKLKTNISNLTFGNI